jgi:mRNA-degrading endonuclease RelE of RelBE toxin-antitoxin system
MKKVPWEIRLSESAVGDFQWFGRKNGRTILEAALEVLSSDPEAETRNLKSLAQRELRLFGKYRILFNLSTEEKVVTVIAAGKKQGNALIVQGKEFRFHHEGHSAD